MIQIPVNKNGKFMILFNMEDNKRNYITTAEFGVVIMMTKINK